MSSLYRCDRCSRVSEQLEGALISMPMIQKNIDLCSQCYLEFREFICEKGNVTLFKNINPYKPNQENQST